MRYNSLNPGEVQSSAQHLEKINTRSRAADLENIVSFIAGEITSRTNTRNKTTSAETETTEHLQAGSQNNRPTAAEDRRPDHKPGRAFKSWRDPTTWRVGEIQSINLSRSFLILEKVRTCRPGEGPKLERSNRGQPTGARSKYNKRSKTVRICQKKGLGYALEILTFRNHFKSPIFFLKKLFAFFFTQNTQNTLYNVYKVYNINYNYLSQWIL